MADQPKTVQASFYATVEPQWRPSSGYWGTDSKGRPILEGAKVTTITQNKPKGRTKAGAVITRLTLEFDAAAFLPLQPEAVIHIGMDQLETVVAVTAEAPEQDEEQDSE